MICVKAKVWFCDPLTCGPLQAREYVRPCGLALFDPAAGLDLALYFSFHRPGEKVSQSGQGNAIAVECCSKNDSRFGRTDLRPFHVSHSGLDSNVNLHW